MTIWHLLPLSVGACIVMQGILNKQFSHSYGLATASFLNAFVFALLAFILFVTAQKSPEHFADFIPPKLSHYSFQWWHLIPGVCGFVIVSLTPWCIRHLGAGVVFVLIISAQIILSALWDHFALGHSLSMLRIVSLLLVGAGATLYSVSA